MGYRKLNILFVEDSEDDYDLVLFELKKAGFEVYSHRVEDQVSLEKLLREQNWDIILSDFKLPGFDGLSALRIVRESGTNTPFVFVSGTIGEDRAVEAMQNGAYDYILKNNLKRLVPAIEKAVQHKDLLEEQKRLTETVLQTRKQDAITDLPNRNGLEEHIQRALELSSRQRTSLALVFINIDRFKRINDSLGSAFGDFALQKIAGRLKENLTESCTIGRVGGNEFVILVSEATEDKILILLHRIRKSFEKPFYVRGQEITITCSAGVSVFPKDGKDAETLIQFANEAMQNCREEHGRNSFAFHAPESRTTARENLTMETEMRKAIENDEFILHYQPQIDVVNNRVIGAEALIRWMHPRRGMIMPGNFIPIAEEVGLIIPLGYWSLRKACETMHKINRENGTSLQVAVNLSSMQFSQRDLLSSLEAILGRTGLPPEQLEIEITEGTLVKNGRSTHEILENISAKGLKIAIDDFGTGYSNLSYLQNFPIDKLKIDKSFVQNMVLNPKTFAIVQTITMLARKLGLTCIAEGVETEKELSSLTDLGCHGIQGYYFSKPVDPDAFADYAINFPTRKSA